MGLGVLHVGFTTKYLSDSIVNGFTLGCTFQIFVSQIATVLGLKLGKIDIPLDLIAVYILSFNYCFIYSFQFNFKILEFD